MRTLQPCLPEDVLPLVFSFLHVKTLFSLRPVCHLWAQLSTKGCAALSLCRSVESRRTHRIGGVTLAGQMGPRTTKPSEKEVREQPKIIRRTRGHLPEPNCQRLSKVGHCARQFRNDLVEDSAGETILCATIGNLTSQEIAIRVGKQDDSKSFVSIDLATSTWDLAAREKDDRDGFGTSQPVVSPHKTTRRLKTVLCQADLSSLVHLRELCVRGCSSLRVLRLPAKLKALDASGCSKLKNISLASDCSELSAVNLNGCRSLQHLLNTQVVDRAMMNVRELAMDSVRCLPEMTIASALHGCSGLVSLSLRYIATDKVMNAIPIMGSLRMVDIAFSPSVSDEGVSALMSAAHNLERINLRGCRGVSSTCYNTVPLSLQKRRRNELVDATAVVVASGDDRQRKGDNLFYLVEAERKSKGRGTKA